VSKSAGRLNLWHRPWRRNHFSLVANPGHRPKGGVHRKRVVKRPASGLSADHALFSSGFPGIFPGKRAENFPPKMPSARPLFLTLFLVDLSRKIQPNLGVILGSVSGVSGVSGIPYSGSDALSRAELGTATISPPRSSLHIFFVSRLCRGSTGWRLHFFCSRSPTQRHDVESVASAGASPTASTNFWPASIKVMQRTFNP